MALNNNPINEDDLFALDVFKFSTYNYIWLVSPHTKTECLVQSDSATNWAIKLTRSFDGQNPTIEVKLLTSTRQPLTSRIEVCVLSHKSDTECRTVIEHNFIIDVSLRRTLNELANSRSRTSPGILSDPFKEGNGFIVDSKLIITIKIQTAIYGSIDEKVNLSALFEGKTISENRLTQDIKCLLEDDESKDVLIRCREGSEYKAHKLLLTARSEVFRMMFNNDMKESRENKIEIDDIEPDIVKELVNYIYTDKVELKCQDKLMQLLQAADKYQLEHLKLLCQSNLLRTLSADSIIKLLMFSDLHNLKMKKYVILYAVAHAEVIFPKDNWKKLMKDNCYLAGEVLEKVLQRIPDKLRSTDYCDSKICSYDILS